MRSVILGLACLCFATAAQAAETRPPEFDRVKHIIVIYLENRSFDNVYGLFEGADNIQNSGNTGVQTNAADIPYQSLPQIVDSSKTPPVPDHRFPEYLPNQPFSMEKYVSVNDKTSDMVHRFYQEQLQIDGGRMDKYVLYSNAGGLPMGYYDGSVLPLWQYASIYALTDHFFHAAFGGSFLNHFWMVCACSPRFPDAPADIVATLNKDGSLAKDGAVTPDGYAINTLEPSAMPHPAGIDAKHLLPPQTMPTIGDRLSEKGIDWAWYAGGYNDAVGGHADPLFEYHHQPFLYFANYAEGTPARQQHLKDEADFLAAVDNNTLPAVSFWKPIGEENEHPGYTDIMSGDKHAAEIIKRVQNSFAWTSSVIIVTYDENGGEWDHVAPPAGDRWGPGTRVPTIIISPFAKPNFVDHTVYDTTSILKFIEMRYGLNPLTDRDANAASLLNTMHFDGQFIKHDSGDPIPKPAVKPSVLPHTQQ